MQLTANVRYGHLSDIDSALHTSAFDPKMG